MKIWPNSTMTMLYYSDAPSEEWPCVVKLSEAEILVEYEFNGFRQYRGQARGPGHYELSAPELSGRASLHRFEGAEVLDGSWVEDGYRGMWRIKLA